ncbi:DUF302 domain-containing protein [Mycoplasmatota bacterium WC30]
MSIIFRVKSNYDFNKTTELIKEAIALKNFSILAEFDLGAKLRTNNLAFGGELLVLEVCNPSYAFSALNANPESSYLLPCRITLSKDKEVTVGIINYEMFNSTDFKLSDSELFVLNEIKQAISIVKTKKKDLKA